ncbi:PREDICTED: circadian clock-controlled protein-like [Drosophila arizonae]|uniref:Circadian clock-controlled protein-like n=1 Tax=Drosophila arizonae TaxID=7263 RepID=A0ABM1Q3W5_DROAR|nr:PREDICTED: circadian clock-controlled protein-like [Drosophila arizonae]
MRKLLIVLIGLQLTLNSECSILPQHIKKCRFGNTTCIRDTANALIRNFPKGIPSVGLKPLDVVHVKDTVLINDRQEGVLWYFFQLLNQINYGFENTTIIDIKGFDEDPTSSKIIIKGQIPRLIYKGIYKAMGRLLWMVQINSTGESESEFLNFRFDFTLKVQTEYRNGKRYLKIYQLVPNVYVDRWIQWLENFFPENTDLTIAMNRIFNANWVEFWNELEKPILEVFTGVFLSMIEDIFYNVSYDDMFLSNNENVN